MKLKTCINLIESWPSEDSSGMFLLVKNPIRDQKVFSSEEEVPIISAAIEEIIEQVRYGDEAYHLSVVLSLALWAKRHSQPDHTEDPNISDLIPQVQDFPARRRLRNLLDFYRDTQGRILYEEALKHMRATRDVMWRLVEDPEVSEENSALLLAAISYLLDKRAECFFSSD